jgi:capsular exopolysaccharide synthesis family protein
MALPIVKRFLISLNENKLYGFLVFLLFVGIAVVIAIQPEEEVRKGYKAVGRLSFNSPPPTFTLTGQELQVQGQAININALLGSNVLEKVASRLNYSFKQIQEIIGEKRLAIILPDPEDASQNTQLITIEYKDDYKKDQEPNEVLSVLTVFMEEMVNESYSINTAELQSRIRNLEQRLAIVQKDLTEAEKNFYNFISTDGSSLLSIQDGSLFGGITNSQQQQRQLQVILSGIDAEIKTLQKQLNLNPDEAYTSAALSADPIIANIRALILQNEIDLDLLEKDLRSSHPRVVELRKQKEVNEKLLEERAVELIGNDGVFEPLSDKIRERSNLDPARLNLASRLVALQAQRESLKQQLESVTNIEKNLRLEYELSPDKQIKQTQLIQQVQSQRILYQTIFAALMDAKSAEVETGSSLTIAQNPFIPRETPLALSKLSSTVIVIIGSGVGIIASLGLIFLLATLDERLHTPQEIRETLTEQAIPILAELPVIKALDPSGVRIPVILDTNSSYLSFYERFRSNIRRLGSQGTKVVLMISVSNEEGKSVSAYNLAIASANAGKRTLLVEADLRTRNPGSSKYFNIQANPESVSNPISYYNLRNDSISLVPDIENLYILPSPGFQQQPAAIIESDEMQRFLKEVRTSYDMVIIDTPSIYRCNDALLLEPFADGIILVTRPGVTLKSLLNETIEEFIEAELPLIGAIINEVESLNPIAEISSSSENNFSFPINSEETELNNNPTEVPN